MDSESLSPPAPTTPPAPATRPRISAFALPSLTWLELKRVARGWRWRALVLVVAAAAFWWRRRGFGPGRPVFFPLGDNGLVGFSALFAAAAALLGVDAISQTARARAARLLDTRPLPDLALAAVRWIAASGLVALAAAGFLAETFFLSYWLGQPCAASPLLAWWLLWWCPSIALAGATGLAARAWLRNDAAAIFASFATLIIVGLAAWRLLSPAAVYTSYAPHLGAILPWTVCLADVGRALLLSLALVALAAVGQRRWIPRTPVHPLPPYRQRLFPSFRRLLVIPRQWLHTDRLTALASLILLAGSCFLLPPWLREWEFSQLSGRDWRADAPPLPDELASSSAPRWSVVRLEADFHTIPPLRPRFTLVVENMTTQTLTWASLALSTVWDDVEAGGRGRNARPGPVPGTWLFQWDPPLPPLTTATLELSARPRQGSDRVRAWAAQPRYADLGRLGAWWPRAAAFDLKNRRAVVPEQPLRYRITLPATLEGHPVGGSSRATRTGHSHVLTSTFPESAILPVVARFVSLEESFEGLPVRLEVFPRHEALADFLFELWQGRFVRLRRALGQPPGTFVFHEAALPPALPDPTAVLSADLDALDEAVEFVDAAEENSYSQFNNAFPPWHRAILQTWIQAATGLPRDPVLLRDSLVDYLHEIAFNRGLQPSPRQLREQANPSYLFIPWRGRPKGPLPFDFREADLPRLRIPWNETDADPPNNELARRRAMAFHHLVRYLLGDAAYADFLRDFLARNTDAPLTRRAFLDLAQSFASQPLEPVAAQLLGPAQLPTFEARAARVFLDRNPETRALEYTTEITVANLGQGRWPVPIILTTEDDQLERRIDLGPGESVPLRLVTRARPIAFYVDPYGWLPQIPRYDPQSKSVQHPRIYFKRVISRVEP